AAQALLQGQPLRLAAGTAAPLYAQLAMRHAHVIPMQLREHGIGVLIVELGDETPAGDRMTSLQAIANQAAVAIGATMLCVNRARTVAVQEERLRIAQDIHDTVSQSLFGIVFTLDGCLKLLPRDPAAVAPELARALQAADAVRQEIRSSILDLWPAQLTADRFAADLQTHAAAACQAQETQFVFDIRGEFGALPPGARRSLYRIAQEALNNVAQHAAAREARVCVEVENGRARLAVRDDGRGFEPAAALARNYGGAHFGLRGMHERARALGGACHVFSKPGAGTSIVVEFPI
ncbi:MAG: sensor histidine kinase, partial [Anaerolineales bacterium]|nr:sensor histidine kinase [Anaerolineales bacterium]